MGKNFCNIGGKWCKFSKKGNCTFCNTFIDTLKTCPRVDAIATKQFAELLKEVNFEDVFTSLCKWFSDQEDSKKGYELVFNYLLTLKPQKMTNLNDLFIAVDKVMEDGQEYLNVSGKQVNGFNPKFYGIEFCPWKDWVSMYITQETLDNLSYNEIVGACLWEMTFFGFEEDKIKERLDKMIKIIDRIRDEK